MFKLVLLLLFLLLPCLLIIIPMMVMNLIRVSLIYLVCPLVFVYLFSNGIDNMPSHGMDIFLYCVWALMALGVLFTLIEFTSTLVSRFTNPILKSPVMPIVGVGGDIELTATNISSSDSSDPAIKDWDTILERLRAKDKERSDYYAEVDRKWRLAKARQVLELEFKSKVNQKPLPTLED